MGYGPQIMRVKHDETLTDYLTTWQAMQAFTQTRDADTKDEVWSVMHKPVYTQGQAGKPEHILTRNSIPIVQTDRGGQITYHGPGQAILYPLLQLKRYGLSVRDIVCVLEKTMITLLSNYNIPAFSRPDAPGVYTQEGKIGSVGLRIKRGCSYHGLALNIDMDLTPFDAIRPCGLDNMKMVHMAQYIPTLNLSEVRAALLETFQTHNPK